MACGATSEERGLSSVRHRWRKKIKDKITQTGTYREPGWRQRWSACD